MIVQNKHHYLAFTLVELLVVIAIIGVLSTLSVVVFNNARAKARDSRRLSDVKQIGMALELYYDDKGRYPPPPTPTGTPITGLCLSNSGFTSTCGTTPYLQKIPSDPLPNIHYTYSYLNSGESYRLGFNLEQGSGDWPAGTLAMGPNGISQDLLAASGIDWRDPNNWKNVPGYTCAVTYDQDRKAIKMVNYNRCVLAPTSSVYLPIDTSRKYYIETEYLTEGTTTYTFYLGTISYDESYNPLPGHPGGHDYFGASGDRPTSTNTWTFVVNKQISGQPRTGESADTSKFDKWHPGTFWAKVVVIPNCCTGPQTTYIRNVRFYVE